MALQEDAPFPRAAAKTWDPTVSLWCNFISTDYQGSPDICLRAGMQLHQQAAFSTKNTKLSLSTRPQFHLPISPEPVLLTVAFSDRYQSGIGMWWFGTFLLLFFWSSDSQSKEFKSGKLLLMSMPSWVHRPKDQPPNSEPLDWREKKEKEKKEKWSFRI